MSEVADKPFWPPELLEFWRDVVARMNEAESFEDAMAIRRAAEAEQLAGVAESKADRGDFLGALLATPREQRHALVWKWIGEGRLDVDDLRRVVADFWMDAEESGYNRAATIHLFKLAGYVTDTDERLTGELTVYRGVSGSPRPGCARGISWTLDLEVARRFARRLAHVYGNPRVYVAKVDSEDVLGFLVERKEREIIVDPKSLRGVRLLERLGEPEKDE